MTQPTAGRFTPPIDRLSRRSFKTSPRKFSVVGTLCTRNPFRRERFNRFDRETSQDGHIIAGRQGRGMTCRSSRCPAGGRQVGRRMSAPPTTRTAATQNPPGCDSVHAAIIDVEPPESRKFAAGLRPCRTAPAATRGNPPIATGSVGNLKRPRSVSGRRCGDPSRGWIATLSGDKGPLGSKLDTMTRVNEPRGGLRKTGSPRPTAENWGGRYRPRNFRNFSPF